MTDQPAFPTPVNANGFKSSETGMTLRDYFAAAALTGLLADGLRGDHVPPMAYAHADAMLKARKQ